MVRLQGTEKSKGTKVFALTGKIKNNGLVEVPMGITLRQIVETIGGGTGTERKIKAIQTGGPSGGMIPEHQFDTPVSYEHLQQLGSMMGSGGLIVIDDKDSVIELARFYLDFCVDESCGKCAPCRIGGTQILRMLDRIVDGTGTDRGHSQDSQGCQGHAEGLALRFGADRAESDPLRPQAL